MTLTSTHVFGAALAAGVVLLTGIPTKAQTKTDKPESQQRTDAGIRFRLQATEKEVGLHVYPGAQPHRDSKSDSPAANIGLWGKSFGFKLVVLKLETKDSPAKVAAFYQKELAKYGKVLDCSRNETTPDAKSDNKPALLTCEDDGGENGCMLFKSGTKAKQHIVNIEPDGQGTVFHLVLLDKRGIDEEQRAQ